MTHLYLSGPMSGRPDNNFPAFNRYADQLRAAGYEVTNPADNGADPDLSWADYMRIDLTQMLDDCDGVAVLSGWEESRGASLEVHVARALEMPVRSVTGWLVNAVTSAERTA